MRNVMICLGAMAALLLLWPVMFTGSGGAAEAAQRTPPVARMSQPAAPLGATARCSQRFARARAICTSGDTPCAAAATDALDICDGTGFWPK